MRTETFTFEADDGKAIFVHHWAPDAGAAKAVVHIAHGMAEHSARYARVAEALTAAGYVVYADDHRGHGVTAKTDAELGSTGVADGFTRMVDDLAGLVAREKRDNPGLPVLLFGHSMGSFMVQSFMIRYGGAIQGAVLSATGGKPNLLASAGRLLARLERLRLGAEGRSALLNAASFGEFNKPFKPARTDFDWLSRDDAEVDRYIADPRCGFVVTTSLWVALLDAIAAVSRPEEQARIPKDLPVYAFSGSRDPVGENTRGVDQLLGAYGRAGLRDVTHRYYPEGRHESLNETNRDEVTRDLVAWLDGHLPRGA